MDNFQKKEENILPSVLPLAIKISKNKRPECVVCLSSDTKRLLKLPCCNKPVCQQCATKLHWKEEKHKTKKCPHCRQDIKVEKKKVTVTRFTCIEFWTTFYFVSYLVMSVAAMGFAIYDIYNRSDDNGSIADNIIVGLIVNGLIVWWFACEYFHEKGNICKMPSTWWGLGPAMGTFVIRFSLYYAPLPDEFMRTYFCSFLFVCAAVVAFFVLWGIVAVLILFWKTIRPIFCDCGHKEERETSNVELSLA